MGQNQASSRNIKFRVWNNETKAWIYGPGQEVNLFGEIIFLADLNDCVALQFTGLLDKNKKEIYEGDRIRGSGGTSGSNNILMVVEYVPMKFVLRVPGQTLDRSLFYDILEVVGNIYETNTK